jgi:hypothetical protein
MILFGFVTYLFNIIYGSIGVQNGMVYIFCERRRAKVPAAGRLGSPAALLGANFLSDLSDDLVYIHVLLLLSWLAPAYGKLI